MKKESRVFIFKETYCQNCWRSYPKVNGRQLYCGSVNRKEGCSYLVHKKKCMARYRSHRNEHRKKMHEYYLKTIDKQKLYQKDYYQKNRLKIKAKRIYG